MLRQALATSSRALRSTPTIAASRAFLRPQIQNAAPAISIRSFQPIASRWYSENKEATETKEAPAADQKTEEKTESSSEGDKNGEPDAVAQLKKDLEAKDKEARDWKDKCLRTVADFRNLQERTAREVKAARDFAIQKFAKDLVDSVDNLDRALSTVPADKLKAEEKSEDLKELANLYEGLKMTEGILIQTLAKHGLERLEPEGAKFDPNEHEATFMAPQPGKEDNTVFFVQQKGFKLNGRVLRAAKVGVVKNS
ncbi:GrpE-domain-containing protein [Trichoderma citrinoviride]|uniref:GrpE protein homolog n=1 Tax=Trichoderma citrinoviride TaxID=58853 RepID=A0A2T4BDD4_9HYPO|nr:GrpE-domain-containing protein [Trichoderma citrinoviride]PTB67353.1 GrpE-domain-containing protein [Trichoderma citrinoviride]